MSETVDCVIIGGGFTGLAAAAELTRLGRSVTIVEAEDQLGGLAGGFDIGGHELEKFYHHWFTSDRHISDLAERIGASDRIVTRPTRTGMYYSGNFFRLSTPLDLLRFNAIPFHDRIRMGIAALAVRRIKDWRKLESISAKDWLISWFGKTVYRVVWGPLLSGKFGRHADEVSAVWFWNKLALRGASRGSKGQEELAYFLGGFAELARGVGRHVEALGGKVRTGVRANAIVRQNEAIVRVDTTLGAISGRSVLVTTPMPIAADLLEKAAGSDYAASLRRIRYLGNICLVLELDRSLSGLYWTNVNDAAFPFVGIIEHTNFEPPTSYGGRHIVYLSKYLPTDEPLYNMNAEELLAFSEPHIKRMFPEFNRAWVKHAYAWREPYAQPLVVQRYSEIIPAFDTPLEGVHLATMAQVYPEDRGTNYAVREGTIAAGRIHANLCAKDNRSERDRVSSAPSLSAGATPITA